MLLTALAQKSLTGSSAASVVESILTLLARLLSPLLLQFQNFYTTGAGQCFAIIFHQGKAVFSDKRVMQL